MERRDEVGRVQPASRRPVEGDALDVARPERVEERLGEPGSSPVGRRGLLTSQTPFRWAVTTWVRPRIGVYQNQ
jgi:hypothetical protein